MSPLFDWLPAGRGVRPMAGREARLWLLSRDFGGFKHAGHLTRRDNSDLMDLFVVEEIGIYDRKLPCP